jgi:hypothetical protein
LAPHASVGVRGPFYSEADRVYLVAVGPQSTGTGVVDLKLLDSLTSGPVITVATGFIPDELPCWYEPVLANLNDIGGSSFTDSLANDLVKEEIGSYVEHAAAPVAATFHYPNGRTPKEMCRVALVSRRIGFGSRWERLRLT